jgi:hypothetical protein
LQCNVDYPAVERSCTCSSSGSICARMARWSRSQTASVNKYAAGCPRILHQGVCSQAGRRERSAALGNTAHRRIDDIIAHHRAGVCLALDSTICRSGVASRSSTPALTPAHKRLRVCVPAHHDCRLGRDRTVATFEIASTADVTAMSTDQRPDCAGTSLAAMASSANVLTPESACRQAPTLATALRKLRHAFDRCRFTRVHCWGQRVCR